MSGGASVVANDSGDNDQGAARLRLYVARDTPNSARAERNLMAALKDLGGGGLVLEVVDVFTHPKRAITDGVIVTPMLIGLRTKGRLIMIGDLTDTAKLMALLQSLLDSAGR
jgi:circadian clock protein KaiB